MSRILPSSAGIRRCGPNPFLHASSNCGRKFLFRLIAYGIEGFMQRNIGVANRHSEHVGVIWLIPYWIVTSCVAIVLVSYTPLSASSVPEKNVLVLCSWPLRSAFGELDTLKETVRLRVSAPVDFYIEYLESQRFGSAGYQQALVETIRQSYGGRHIDLVVVVAYPALQFAIDHREQLFPDIPIVFITVPSSRLPDGVPWPGVTGV